MENTVKVATTIRDIHEIQHKKLCQAALTAKTFDGIIYIM